MSKNPLHSPAPFSLRETPAGYILVDGFGDSIGALAASTGDHDREEQRANAQLFLASPKMLATLKAAEAFLVMFHGGRAGGELLIDVKAAIAAAEVIS